MSGPTRLGRPNSPRPRRAELDLAVLVDRVVDLLDAANVAHPAVHALIPMDQRAR